MKSHICTTRFTSVQLIGFLDTGYQFFVSPSGNGAGLGVTPWWTKWMNTGQADIAPAQETAGMSPFGLGLGVLDLGWDPMNGRHMTTKPSSFPKLFGYGGFAGHANFFDEGGPYNDEFMKYYGLSWVPANQIFSYDPYYKGIQQHDPNGIYAVNSDGLYVPVGEMKEKWNKWEQFEKAIPDAKLRNGLITYIDSNVQDTDTLGAHQRLFDVFNAGGAPPTVAFNPFTDGRAATLTPYVVSSHIREKLPFSSLTLLSAMVPDILVKQGMNAFHTGQHVFDELGHWWQYNPIINHGHRFSENDNWSLLTGNTSDAKMEHSSKSSYGTPGAFEHSAHLGHDAVLGSYVFNTTPEYYLKHIAKPIYWLQDKDDGWYEQNKKMYQDTIKTIPQAIQYSDSISRSMADYGKNQHDLYWNDPELGTHRRLSAIHRYGW